MCLLALITRSTFILCLLYPCRLLRTYGTSFGGCEQARYVHQLRLYCISSAASYKRRIGDLVSCSCSFNGGISDSCMSMQERLVLSRRASLNCLLLLFRCFSTFFSRHI